MATIQATAAAATLCLTAGSSGIQKNNVGFSAAVSKLPAVMIAKGTAALRAQASRLSVAAAVA